MAVASQYCCSLHSCLLIHQHALGRFVAVSNRLAVRCKPMLVTAVRRFYQLSESSVPLASQR